jgi:hypothetical protein
LHHRKKANDRILFMGRYENIGGNQSGKGYGWGVAFAE